MAASKFNFKVAARAASTANVAGTFANPNNGPGDTLTATTGATLVVDGVTLAVGDRVLLKNQTTGYQNGMYYLSQAGVAGKVATFGAIVQPTSATLRNGTYQNIALTGGTGTGAAATIVVSGGAVTQVNVTSAGLGYTVGDTLTFDASGQGFGDGGSVDVLTVTTGAYAGAILTTNNLVQPTETPWNGTYSNFPLTGGTGTGATANITVANGVVTSVVLVNPGSGYTAADVLGFSGTASTPTEGLGTGGTVVAATITFTPAVLARTPDANVNSQLVGMAAWISAGTTNINTVWTQTVQTVTVDTTALTFVNLLA